jgi:hypothetical protein
MRVIVGSDQRPIVFPSPAHFAMDRWKSFTLMSIKPRARNVFGKASRSRVEDILPISILRCLLNRAKPPHGAISLIAGESTTFKTGYLYGPPPDVPNLWRPKTLTLAGTNRWHSHSVLTFLDISETPPAWASASGQ